LLQDFKQSPPFVRYSQRQRAGGRRQEAEGRRQEVEGRRQRAEGRGQEAGSKDLVKTRLPKDARRGLGASLHPVG